MQINMNKVKLYALAAVDFIFGFRKFIVMCALITSGIVFLINGKINGREFVDLLQNTTVAFMAANGVEKIGDVVKAFIESKAKS